MSQQQKKPFRFYIMWVLSPDFLPIVERNWSNYVYGCHMFRIVTKLKWIKHDLKQLNKGGFSSVEADQLNLLTLSLLQKRKRWLLLSGLLTKNTYLTCIKLPNCIGWNMEMRIPELFTKASNREENIIRFTLSIQQIDGTWVNSPIEVQSAFTDFYGELFCSNMTQKAHVDHNIMDKGPRLSEEHKMKLECSFTLEDVKRVLHSISNNKAPAIMDFFNTAKILKEVNVTSITLVPKVSVPASVGDFRPIACCSVIYKCISKLLCEKLGSVLPDVISNTQGAFVSGRSILHNVMVCQDIIKMYRGSQKQPNCFMKLDLRKSYDTVEWGFIAEVMTDLGFPEHFIKLIMTCLSTTQYSLLLNGVPS
ncbi:uncharacterized protein [Spinacia oleracea]|uniref:Reverse transcriptase domain-containing protein n=1 Tax=Spinacia oleracea TaxID=3562 RepID=A0ABM3QQU3_SPIOL|nr:uncharacterized protein LOC130461579 [Spinacia oleracea]